MVVDEAGKWVEEMEQRWNRDGREEGIVRKWNRIDGNGHVKENLFRR